MVEYPDAAGPPMVGAEWLLWGVGCIDLMGTTESRVLVVGLSGWMSAACGGMWRAGPRRYRASGRGRKSHARREEQSGPSGCCDGAGRKYLLAIGGEGKAPLSLEVAGTDVAVDKSSTCLDDTWAFQLPPGSMAGASVKEATRHAIKMDVRQAKWAEVQYITTLMPVEKRRKRFLGSRG